MDQPAEWRALAARFSEMIPDMQSRYGGPLSAQWLPPEASKGQDQWKLIGIGIGYPPAPSPFKAAAERAAVLLGQPDGPSSLFFWLDLLKSESPHYEISPLSYKNADGAMVHGEGGLITNLCLASAEHCYKLETRAIAKTLDQWLPVPGPEPRSPGLMERSTRQILDAQVRAQAQIEYERHLRMLREEEERKQAAIISELDVTATQSTNRIPEDAIAAERTALLLAFKLKGRKQGIKITDEMVAKAAKPEKWNTRTMVTWWKRNDKRCKPLHDRLIRTVLAKDPKSIEPSR